MGVFQILFCVQHTLVNWAYVPFMPDQRKGWTVAKSNAYYGGGIPVCVLITNMMMWYLRFFHDEYLFLPL